MQGQQDTPQGPERDEFPVNPLPPAVVFLTLLLFGIELAFQAGTHGFAGGADGVGWRLAAARSYGFSGKVLDWMISNNHWPPGELARFVTYPFIHAGFMHMLMVCVFTLALGKMVGEVFGGMAVLVVFFVSSIVGALVYGLALDDPRVLIGGFPGAYGLIGSYTFLLWISLAGTGANQMRAFSLITLLMGVQLLFGLLFGGGHAWVAELSGFVTGFAISFALVPGAFARALSRLRSR